MKDVKFKKIVLTGFRGQNREIVFNKGITSIAGANGTGKTTVYVAAKWCLTGADELNRVNYNLFDDTLDFSHENARPAIVELYVEIDGVDYILKRQATQKWVRKRGDADYVKAPSDDYKFYVDGLELSATTYKETMRDLFGMDAEKLKLCMDVLYYQMLDWKELRKHFADIVGEISDADMTGDYRPIYPYLEKFKGGEKAKEFLRQQINPLKQQVKELDADIKATERMLPDLGPVAEAERRIAEKKERLAEINKEILGLEAANKPFIEKRKAELADIAELKKRYADEKIKHETAQRMVIAELQEKLRLAERHNATIESRKKDDEKAAVNHKTAIMLCKEDIEDLTQEIDKLRAQNKELKSREFSDTTCPNCGQELPADMIAELRTKFYEDIDKQRMPIVERGKILAARLESQKKRLAQLESEVPTAVVGEDEKINTDDIRRMIAETKQSTIEFADTDVAHELNGTIDEKTANLAVVPEVNSAELQNESRALVSDISELSKLAARRETYERGTKDIEAYREQRRAIGIELAKWEGLLELFMAREREWADIVRDRANEYLEHSHVEMLEMSKSGELVDTCTLSINNVDRGVTNHANKTIVGIDVSNAICKRYGVKMPLFIDDFEHFTSEMTYAGDRQVVTLSADKHYNELTTL